MSLARRFARLLLDPNLDVDSEVLNLAAVNSPIHQIDAALLCQFDDRLVQIVASNDERLTRIAVNGLDHVQAVGYT